ncbi:MAG: nucleotidyltransferase domain-containing protein [Herpetosiphonaceae bacterium]|nr:nucleotidyltransferase domain-containing protein [Herpetosiphonaceae bacterium]
MDLQTRLDRLQHTLVQALRELPGARALCLFGSLAGGTGDQYSDIDLQVMTSDLPATVAACHEILERVDLLALELPIVRASDSWASTFLFHNRSCYHKVDLGFTATASIEHVLTKLAGPRVILWEQEASITPATIDTPSFGSPYVPELETLEHFVIGQLFGGVRYVKARKREHRYTTWRFASAMANGLATIRLQQKLKWVGMRSSLNTWAYVELDSMSSPDEFEPFFAALDFSRARTMDHGVCQLLEQIVETAETCGSFAENVAASVATKRLLDFIRTELTEYNR